VRSLDLGGRHADAVTFQQQLVGAGRQAVDANQVVLGPGAGQSLAEELGDGDASLDLDIVGETATRVIDLC
jgi:hypothetical protein